ncbi:rho GTPase-activating protein SYDE2 isoform X2 [Gadus macrocephalus]|uniref:rho GTPase-activating protein SYDE2 isoform X2 n=1 Tax=Gadus macrocephalus TaxID=80720 RepID=UPI0028CB7BFD|nr:rho GTPase-activating protein SYDE2 isoform X2 [Gadus macrocephalus]
MADPLRRTILAKLRGKKLKKGASAGGGYGCSAATAKKDGEELDCGPATERMSTYENFDNGALVEVGGFLFRKSKRVVFASACPRYEVSSRRMNPSSEEREPTSSRCRYRVNEELLGVPVQRGVQFWDYGKDTILQEPYSLGKAGLPSGERVAGLHTPGKHFPRKYSVGDSIGFGENHNHHVSHTQLDSNSTEVVDAARISDLDTDSVCLNDKEARVHRYGSSDRSLGMQHMAESVVAVNQRRHNADSNYDHNRPINTKSATCTTLINPTCDPSYCLTGSNTEETILIRNIESYESSEFSGKIRLINLQSPTYFPPESEINMSSLCATEGSPIRHSLDSEDEDYYDNEILPFYESVRNGANEMTRGKNHEVVQSRKDRGQGLREISILETDRLRSQLKEAYYLLINAMHDINLDVQQQHSDGKKQQTYSSSSSPSRDSLCSRLSVKNMDSDSWSSGGDQSPQRLSDSNPNLLCVSGTPGSWCRGSSPLDSISPLDSSSLGNLLSITSSSGPPIPRSASDGAISYHHCRRGPVAMCEGAADSGSPDVCEDLAVVEPTGLEVQKEGRGGHQAANQEATSSNEQPQDGVGNSCRMLYASGGSFASLTGSSDNNNADTPLPDAPKDPTGAQTLAAPTCTLARQGHHHGVTVNKMQEWMHKGRLLSSEMKQRIEGSSSSSSSTSSSSPPAGHKAWEQEAILGAQRVKPLGHGGDKPVPKSPRQSTASSPQQHPVPDENAQGREPNQRPNEPPGCRSMLNSITVSKKRNWLQQSSLGRVHGVEEPLGDLGADEEGGQPLIRPSSSPELLMPPGVSLSRPVRFHLPQAQVMPQIRCIDPAEENDADDEGEIWYNPIPEDEEPAQVTKNNPPSRRPVASPPQESQAPKRRPSRCWDGGSCRTPDTSTNTARPERLREGGGLACIAGGGDGSQGNATHSIDTPHLHRQMLSCKSQEEAGASGSRATEGSDDPQAAGFSPPSSPNPAKKPSSLNWSFPDKIKSPRTVRKISMKMKRLPELRRKLSVKGYPSNANSSSGGGNRGSQSETRANSFRLKSSGPEAMANSSRHPRFSTPGGGGQASHNVISRYHLDSSVSTQHNYGKKENSGVSKSANKGGYLSDGDTPELVAKSGKRGCTEGSGRKCKELGPGSVGAEKAIGGTGTAAGGGGPPKLHGTELDIDAFRPYSFSLQPKCSQYISGLMSLHFYGAEDLKLPRVDSRDVYCAIQVDSVNKARTALLTCRTSFLEMDHTFNIELENAQHLKLVVFSWESAPKQRNRVCCHGMVVLPALFRVTRSHQLTVKLEPRGLIYVKLNLMEHWQNSLDGGGDGSRERRVFGVEAWRVVERESTGLLVPLLIHKCITEIENRGCQVVGLYRLCGSAVVKKELREAFERDSLATELCENTYPDINVITGVLKDYLRELPYPLITKQLYEAVLETMVQRPLRIGASGCENDAADTQHTVSLLEKLPEVERVTLRKLLDHLKLVASHQEVNKMTCQNLAVCFGPVLLSQRQEASCHTNRVFIDSEELASALHFKKHIEVLHYLLQLWPVIYPGQPLNSTPTPHASSSLTSTTTAMMIDLLGAPPPLRRRKERPQVLNLNEAEMAGVLRPKPGRLDSPSNRYAGDWSCCGESYFGVPEVPMLSGPQSGRVEADYDDVPSEAGVEEEEQQEKEHKVYEVKVEEEVKEKPEARQHDWEDGSEKESEKGKEGAVEEEKDDEKRQETDKEEVEEDDNEEEQGEVLVECDSFGCTQPLETKMKEEVAMMEHEEEEKGQEEEERLRIHMQPHLQKKHAYQAYVNIQDISPVLSNRVNLRDLQESIDTLIGNLERELNKNKLNVGY